jgi:outer membrane biosynthesis protein TonB
VPLFQDETQPENHLERSTQRPLPPGSVDAQLQRKRMLIALGILLAALAGVVLKDWDFWFPPGGDVQEAGVRSQHKRMAARAADTPATPARERKPAKSAAPAATEAPPFSATTERAALPALQVEVVAGNRHTKVPPKSNAIDLDVNSGATSSVSSAPASAPNAPPDRVQLSPQTTESVSVSVPPDYPLLARQMKVQGAVRLQALISRDGTIQELQWHFKPYLQNGQPVETQARITVNFTISTN